MSTTTRAPQVWRGYDALAQADEPIGSHYSPNALTALRLLAWRPVTAGEIARVVGARASRVQQQTLARLVALELVAATHDGLFELTEHGRALVALIDEEGIA